MHSHFSSPKIQFDLLFFVTIIKLPCINFFSKFRCNKEILQLYNKFSSRLKHYLVWFNYSNQKFLRKILKILNSCRYAFWKERCHISSNLISFALCRSKVEQYISIFAYLTLTRSNACVLRSRSGRKRDREDFENLERECILPWTQRSFAFIMRLKK